MQSHRLILEFGPPDLESQLESDGPKPKSASRDTEWLLEWDHAKLTLTAPDGEVVLESAPGSTYKLVDLSEMYEENRISISSPKGSYTFKKDFRALPAVRQLVEAGLANDDQFRTRLQREALRGIGSGLLMFVVGSTLFGLYCWYACRTPDPPRGHWTWLLTWVICAVGVILFIIAVGGPFTCLISFRKWLRMRRIAHSEKTAQLGA
jgi:hypothetical protein